MTQLFVIRRAVFLPEDDPSDLKTGRLVRGFFDRERAEEFRAHLGREMRQRSDINPFQFSHELHECTSFAPPILGDWLLDAGLTPPSPDLSEWISTWRAWWETYSPRFTELQRERVWQGLDKVQCFELLAMEWAEEPVVGKSKVYVLIRRPVSRGGRYLPERDELLIAYRNRAVVEHQRRRLWHSEIGESDEFRASGMFPVVFPIAELVVNE
jgi:hypothetical protein